MIKEHENDLVVNMYVSGRSRSTGYKRAKYKKNEISGGRVIETLNIDGERPLFHSLVRFILDVGVYNLNDNCFVLLQHILINYVLPNETTEPL